VIIEAGPGAARLTFLCRALLTPLWTSQWDTAPPGQFRLSQVRGNLAVRIRRMTLKWWPAHVALLDWQERGGTAPYSQFLRAAGLSSPR